MNLGKIWLLPVLALSSLTMACGDACESSCEDAKECAALKELLKDVDCEKDCEEDQKRAEKMGCEDQRDDYVDCYSDVDDVCKVTGTECATEAAAMGACEEKYCASHEDDADCDFES
jgi:hypothetical protein